jgi:hypothetical protein
VVDDAGVRQRAALLPQYTTARFDPEDLLLLSGPPPFGGLAWQLRMQAPGARGQASLAVVTREPLGRKSRLILYEADRLRTDLSFELRDLQLP